MTHGSLFSGFGAPELAAEWLGWDNIFHCEMNDFCSKILDYWFPYSKSYKDVRNTDFTKYKGQIDVLTGGFPCQPFSNAGKRKGANDNRYLWPQMLRVIQEIRPTWVIGENVAGILSMVQPGKEIEVDNQTSLFEKDNKKIEITQEYVVETVCKDLESAGYSVQPIVIPACAIGAPHQRNRIWFIANSNDAGNLASKIGVDEYKPKEIIKGRNKSQLEFTRYGNNETSTDTDSERQKRCANGRITKEIRENSKQQSFGSFCSAWEKFPAQSPICGGDDGIPNKLDGITFSKWRNESIKGYGNAMVPQVIYQIFKAIEEV